MTVYRYSDPDFFDKVTSEGMEWTRSGAQELGWDVAAVALRDDPDDESAPAVLIAKLSGGSELVRHAHSAYRVEILLRGSMTTSDGQRLSPGDVQVSKPGEAYGPTVVGPEGALMIEIIGTVDGIPALLHDENASPEELALVAEQRDRIARHKEAAAAARAARRV